MQITSCELQQQKCERYNHIPLMNANILSSPACVYHVGERKAQTLDYTESRFQLNFSPCFSLQHRPKMVENIKGNISFV